MKELPRALLLLTLITAFAGGLARGQIVVVAPTASAAGSLQIVSDITFEVTTSGLLYGIYLENWVTHDGTNTNSLLGSLNYAINGVEGVKDNVNLYDNVGSSTFTGTPYHGMLYVGAGGGITLSAGDTFTLLAGAYTLGAMGDFNPEATQTFIGAMSLTSNLGGVMSATTYAIPEPSTTVALAGAVALGGVLLWRRRRVRG